MAFTRDIGLYLLKLRAKSDGIVNRREVLQLQTAKQDRGIRFTFWAWALPPIYLAIHLLLVSPLAIFCMYARCAIWTNDWRDCCSFHLSHSAAHIHDHDEEEAHSHILSFFHEPSVQTSEAEQWACSGPLPLHTAPTTYIFLPNAIMICVAILLANFRSRRHFLHSSLSLSVHFHYHRASIRVQLYKRTRAHKMQ